MKLFSVRVKEILEPIVCKKKATRILFFYKRYRYLSNSTRFSVKKTYKLEGNLYLTENWLSKSKMWCAVHEVSQNFTYSQKLQFQTYDLKATDQLLLPYNFMLGTCKKSSFLVYVVVSPLV